jgi:hypothetical protein
MASSSRSSARRSVALLVALVAVAASACASGHGTDADADGVVTGLVSQVTGNDTAVDAFVLVDDEGSSHLFVPGVDLTCDGEPLVHLREHLLERDTLRVTYATNADGALEATSIVHLDG